jgi:hypothetical protein
MMGYSGIGKRCDTCARTPNAPRFSRHSARLLLVVCCTPASTYAALRPGWTTGHSTYQASVIYPKDVVPLRESRRWRRHENMIRGESRGNRSDSGKVLSRTIWQYTSKTYRRFWSTTSRLRLGFGLQPTVSRALRYLRKRKRKLTSPVALRTNQSCTHTTFGFRASQKENVCGLEQRP